MVDDLMGIAECGIPSIVLNSFINTKIELKNLRFHTTDKSGKKSKCHWIHVGKEKYNCCNPKVHGTEMKEVTKDVYLGETIRSDGKNTSNFDKRISKGIGIVTQIFNILDVVGFGRHYIEIGITLRNTMLVNGMLTSGETWYNLKEKEIDQLEKIDRSFLKKLLRTPVSSPQESLYLELGILPFRSILKQRRLNYLQYLCQRNPRTMLFQFFKAQWEDECARDRTEQVKKDLKDFKLTLSLEEITELSQAKYKRIIKERIMRYTFEYLKEKKKFHLKMMRVQYNELKMQDYIVDNRLDTEEKRLVYKYRVHMLKFWKNFKKSDDNPLCPHCSQHEDCQDEMQNCGVLKTRFEEVEKCQELYGNEVKSDAVQILKEIMRYRDRDKEEKEEEKEP